MVKYDGKGFSWNKALFDILVCDMINLLYDEYWTDKQK